MNVVWLFVDVVLPALYCLWVEVGKEICVTDPIPFPGFRRHAIPARLRLDV